MNADMLNVIKRLETATVRLEEIVRSKGVADSSSSAGAPASRDLGGSSGGAAGGAVHPSVSAFDEQVMAPLAAYVDLANKVGGLVAEQAAFRAQRGLIEIAANSKKPDMTALQALLAPTQKEIEAVTTIREKNRPSPLFNHLSAVSEGIPALGWVVIETDTDEQEPAPTPYVAEYKDSCQFYSNRVIKDAGDKKDHVDFVRSFATLLTELQGYVKKVHTTGLAWNPRGGDAKSFTPSSSGPSAPSSSSSAAAPATGALFSALSKGEGVTSGLRKVEKSEMTHKNPELRAGSVVPAVEKPAAAAAPKFGGAVAKAPPKKALEGNKWGDGAHVTYKQENFNNDSAVVIDNTEIKQVVYIYGCTNSTITIKGKVSAVAVDNCKKCGVLIDSVVATVDVVNTKSSQIQVQGVAPIVSIDKTDGLQLYLSKACVAGDVSVMTAKSSEVNVLIEGLGEDGGYAERPVPEQFKSVITGDKLITSIVEHKG
ncbi:F-actin-capping protein subunit alpha [Irineochytrium annulatum]|nr:F-actin-capping protein subunit alpha [Irineochytrium annulatum]